MEVRGLDCVMLQGCIEKGQFQVLKSVDTPGPELSISQIG